MHFRLALAMLVLMSPLLAQCQESSTDLTRVFGETDLSLPTPTHSAHRGQDVAALQQLAGFIKATNLKDWRGLVATGTITIGGDPASYPAHLSIAGGASYRLDVEKQSGTESFIVRGTQGLFSTPHGRARGMSSDIAFGGLLTLPRVLTKGYPVATSQAIDDGSVEEGGISLHRITLEDAAFLPDGCTPWEIVDLYFNTSNLLVSSAINGRLSSDDRACYFVLTTYGDYQAIGDISFPLSISQSLNGQLQWELKLTSASFSAPSDQSIFNF